MRAKTLKTFAALSPLSRLSDKSFAALEPQVSLFSCQMPA